jgi:2-methylcitrate dehydratase PrpD
MPMPDGNDAETPALARVTDFTLGLRPEDVPAEVMERAALLLLDTLGIAAAAAPMEAGVLARETALALFAAGGPDSAAPMLFDGRRASLAGAVFAAATQIDNLDGHDGFNLTKGHIGVVAVPTLCALAEGRDLSGPEALAALVVGYEVAGRAGIALHAMACDYHTSGAWNALGVAGMAARLRGLSSSQLREALGIAEYHGPRSQMMREIANPTMLHDGSSWGALAGMTAAFLAERGFTGAPAVTVEAPEVAVHWADLGRDWVLPRQYVKPYPTCRWAHPAIDAARELCLAHGIRPAAIVEVRVRSFAEAAALFPGLPTTTSQAQYALSFPVAVMLVHGRIGLEHISGVGLADAAVAALVSRIRVAVEPRHAERFPAERWASVEIELTDGRALASGDVQGRGGPERPFEAADIVAKFHDFADPALGRERALALREACLALPGAGARFADLARHLHGRG